MFQSETRDSGNFMPVMIYIKRFIIRFVYSSRISLGMIRFCCSLIRQCSINVQVSYIVFPESHVYQVQAHGDSVLSDRPIRTYRGRTTQNDVCRRPVSTPLKVNPGERTDNSMSSYS